MTAEQEHDGTHFGKRFRDWRHAKGLSAYWLAKKAGVHPSFFSNIEAERRPMPPKLMKKLASIPELGLTYETLRAWKLESDYDPEEVQRAHNDMVQSLAEVKTSSHLLRLPLKILVQAKPSKQLSLTAESGFVDWLGFDDPTVELFCIKVQGQFLWPPIPDGAVLLVQDAQYLNHGDKYLIEKDQTFILARYDMNNDHLIPLNPDEAVISYDSKTIQNQYQLLSYRVDQF